MPCIQLSTNKRITPEKEVSLKARFGKAIKLIPRKTEKWLMCAFYPETAMWFQGEERDLAFVDVGIFGEPAREACDLLTAELTGIIAEELGLTPDNIYVKYSTTPCWGWNGKNF